MTFKMWYEEIENKPYANLSLQEKSALEYRFFNYLRNNTGPGGADPGCSSEIFIKASKRISAVA